MKTRTHLAIALASAAVVLTLIVAIAPQSTIIASEVSGEVYGIDVLGLTRAVGNLPEQQYAAF